MPELPDIPALDFLLGLASAGVLLWTALYVARNRAFDSLWNERREDSKRGELSLYTPAERPSAHLAFLASLFTHLLFVALAPWLEALVPGELPFDFQRYDMVIVQFKTREPPLRLPPLLAAQADETEDAGRGAGREATERDKRPDGEQRASEPLQRVEIIVPERPRPIRRALAEVARSAEVAIALPTPSASLAGTTWTFDTAEWAAIPHPNEPPRPEPSREAGVTRPALADLAPLGEAFDDEGYGVLLAPSEEQSGLALLADALGAGLSDLFGGSAGTGEGDGMGDGSGPGAAGEGGAGVGWNGRGPVPRKLHGIIVVSNEASTIPEAAGVLTGNPVYTVYVKAPGFDKKWVLQVCTPGRMESNVVFEGGVVKVLPRKNLDPPFALHKVPVTLDFEAGDPRSLPPRIVVYARVEADGELRDLRIVSGLDPQTDTMVLAKLQQWDFHPAYRDGAPVAVEAIFGIPLR